MLRKKAERATGGNAAWAQRTRWYDWIIVLFIVMFAAIFVAKAAKAEVLPLDIDLTCAKEDRCVIVEFQRTPDGKGWIEMGQRTVCAIETTIAGITCFRARCIGSNGRLSNYSRIYCDDPNCHQDTNL